MQEILARLKSRPWVTVELTVASLVASVLALASSIFSILVLNRYIGYGVDTTLATLAAGAVLAVALEFGFRRVRLNLAEGISAPKDRAISTAVFDILTRARSSQIESLSPAIRRQIVAGTETVQSAYSASNLCAFLDVPMALIFLLALVLLNAALALIATGFIAVALVLSLALLSSLRAPTKDMTNAAARRGTLTGGAISAGDTVRAFNAQNFLRRLWQIEVRGWDALKAKIAARQNLVISMNSSAQALMGIAVTTVGAILVVRGQLDIGSMIGANLLAARAFANISKLAHLAQEFSKARQALDMLREFSRLTLERTAKTDMPSYGGRLEFKDLGFVYPGNPTPLFESVSLTLEPGTILVITGANGTGKSTFARLILGLLEPVRGQIFADGVDLQQIGLDWWRRQIVYLPQEPRLLNCSFRDNLLAANPAIDEARIQRLVDAAGLRAHFDRSPGGLAAPILNNGDGLSLGLRRRYALARAFANDGALAVFDEPTEGLDQDGMAHVYRALNELARRKHTIIALSHDPNILKGAHVVLDLNAKPEPKVTWLRAAQDRSGPATGLTEVPA